MRVVAKAAAVLSLGLSMVSPSAHAWDTGPFHHERTQLRQKANATSGRYLYVGTAPRFDGRNLELYISKMTLTLRVKGWVTPEMQADYAAQLIQRWRKIYDAFQSPSMSFEELESADEMMAETRDSGMKAWLTIAKQYMTHALEASGLDVYAQKQDKEEYKRTILTAILRTYLDNPGLTLEDGVQISDRLAAGVSPSSLGIDSQALFKKHLGDLYTPDSSRNGASGFLTFVYPIAATTAGPFSQPKEGMRQIGLSGSIEARQWSDKWDDEFGGMPFMLIEYSGIAFHGPISNKAGADVWYLRRGYVSHGCHRMDSSDVMELRTLFPPEFFSLGDHGKGVRTAIMDWPDVTDVDGDGQVEAMDVAYYEIPGSVSVSRHSTIESAAAPYLMPNAQKRYWKSQFAAFNGKLKGAQNRFDVEEGAFHNIPKYNIEDGKLVRDGVWETVPVRVAAYRGNRVIQYREQGTPSRGYEDTAGKFPPSYFTAE